MCWTEIFHCCCLQHLDVAGLLAADQPGGRMMVVEVLVLHVIRALPENVPRPPPKAPSHSVRYWSTYVLKSLQFYGQSIWFYTRRSKWFSFLKVLSVIFCIIVRCKNQWFLKCSLPIQRYHLGLSLPFRKKFHFEINQYSMICFFFKSSNKTGPPPYVRFALCITKKV